MSPPERIEFYGAPGSPYTRKMLAAMRYRRIPYSIIWSNGPELPEGYPRPKVLLMPTFFFPDEGGALEAVTDSTPIIRRLESMHPARSIIPDDPVLAFLNYLIEDYADEWLTKAMFHYRWAQQPDIDHAGEYLVYMSMPTIAKDAAQQYAKTFADRQTRRLYVVGSNDTTRQTIEESYCRLIQILDVVLQTEPFLFGQRPSSADFALYGQLTQLVGVDPTPISETKKISMRIPGWVDRMEDLSGLRPSADGWIQVPNYRDRLYPILSEIGRVYAPFLLANAAAVSADEKSFETEIDGRPWRQPSFPYQAKCLNWIRREYNALSESDRNLTDDVLAGAGCGGLVTGNDI